MIRFTKSVVTTNGGIELPEAYFVLANIFISNEENKVVAQFNVYKDKDSMHLGVVNGVQRKYVFRDDDFDALVKSMNSKTKLLGKLKSIMEAL